MRIRSRKVGQIQTVEGFYSKLRIFFPYKLQFLAGVLSTKQCLKGIKLDYWSREPCINNDLPCYSYLKSFPMETSWLFPDSVELADCPKWRCMVETGLDAKIKGAKSSEQPEASNQNLCLLSHLRSKARFPVQKPRSARRHGPKAGQERNQDIQRQQIKRQSETRKHWRVVPRQNCEIGQVYS